MSSRYSQVETTRARIPQTISARPRYRGASGKRAGLTPGICCIRIEECTIAKPNPISETAVHTQDFSVRSTLSRVRNATNTAERPSRRLTSGTRHPAIDDCKMKRNDIGPLGRRARLPPLGIQKPPSYAIPKHVGYDQNITSPRTSLGMRPASSYGFGITHQGNAARESRPPGPKGRQMCSPALNDARRVPRTDARSQGA